MRILKVQLTNIKSYGEQTVELAPGTNSICGQNGAGKTTILEAVGWALFGYLSYNQQHFVRDGASWGQVAVTFVARDGREYQVVRRGGSGSMWYVFDPEIGGRLAEGAADMHEWLRTNLGAGEGVEPRVLFENAVGVPQGGLCGPFLQTPERRKQTFDPILRVHEYAKAFTQLLETRRALERAADEFRAGAARHDVLAAELPGLEREIAEILSHIDALARQLAQVERDLDAQSRLIQLLEARRKALQEREHHVSRLEQRVADLETRRRREQADVDKAWQAQETVERTSKAHALWLSARRKLDDTAAQHREFVDTRRDHDSTRQELAYIRQSLENLVTKLEAAEESQSRLPELQERFEQLERARQRLRELQRLAAELPALEDRLRQARSQQEDNDSELGHLASTVEQIEARWPEAERIPELEAADQALSQELHGAEQAEQAAKAAGVKLRAVEQ
ncbi:MAG: AAA family ATPase, partial [Chloroflexota bacterium]|nr:AAA family ATPase [Chloroflexota bacterium]